MTTKKNISLREIYFLTFETFKKHNKVLIPFAIFVGIEALALVFIYFLPRMPLVKLFGPPIRTFWGENFLHYPTFFILLPKLASHVKTILSCLIGGITSAMAVMLVQNIYLKQKLDIKKSFLTNIKKYIYFFIIIFIVTALFYGITNSVGSLLAKYFIKGQHAKLLFIKSNIWLGPIMTIFGLITALGIQALFIYAFPFIVIENKKLFPAIWQGILLLKKFFLKNLILIGIPMLLFIPIIMIQTNTIFLISKTFPEITFFVGIISIIVNSLIIDSITTISTTYLFLKNREVK